MTHPNPDSSPAPRKNQRGAKSVALTSESKASRAVNDAMSDVRRDLGLDALPPRVSDRILRYAERNGLITPASPSARGNRAEWATRSGLRLLIAAAEVVVQNDIREHSDPCHPDVIAVRRCVTRWAKDVGDAKTIANIRTFGRPGELTS